MVSLRLQAARATRRKRVCAQLGLRFVDYIFDEERLCCRFATPLVCIENDLSAHLSTLIILLAIIIFLFISVFLSVFYAFFETLERLNAQTAAHA